MSTDIILPPLSIWIENLITAVYDASSTEISNVLDNFLSKCAVIRFNGKEISRDDLTKELQGENLLEVETSVKILGVVEVPANKDVLFEVISLYFHSNFVELTSVMVVVQAGSVGIFFTVTVQGRDRVKHTPVRKIATTSLNVVYVFNICDLTVLFNFDLRPGCSYSPALNRISVSPPPHRGQSVATLTEEGLKRWTLWLLWYRYPSTLFKGWMMAVPRVSKGYRSLNRCLCIMQ